MVEKYKDYLHYKQLADLIDLEKIYRILRDLLVTCLFKLELTAKANFLTLFSFKELGNNIALIMKCIEDGFKGRRRQRDRTNPDVPPFLDILYFPNTLMPNGTSLESALIVRQHYIDRKSKRIKKFT